MPRHAKLVLATATATLLMTIAVTGAASARSFSFSNGNFRAVWTSVEFRVGGSNIRCPITLEGSFHSRTISKVEKALIGYITRASVAALSCTGGRTTVHSESLPWHITYSGFTGRLPEITTIHLLVQNARFQLEFSGLRCTGTVDTVHQIRGEVLITAEGQVENVRPDPSPWMGIEGTLCPTTGEFGSREGDGRITLLGNTTRIMVSLI
jgi:hypothetical protein